MIKKKEELIVKKEQENQKLMNCKDIKASYAWKLKNETTIQCLNHQLNEAKKFIYTEEDFEKIKKNHKKQLDQSEHDVIENLPPYLREQIKSFKESNIISGLNLDE